MARMKPRSILITGASSGIGAALAAAYAAPGVSLHLGGRDRARLSLVVDRCRLLGAAATGTAVDVTDAAAMAGWINAADARAPLDLVIANAGVSTGGAAQCGLDGPAATRQVFRTNVDGVLNTVLPALERMRARPLARRGGGRPRPGERGGIAIMASLAAFRGMPGAPAYSASKAAMRAWGEALAIRLRPEGIAVTVICPGFVDTPMTARNAFRMPLLMTAERAAAAIRRRLARGPSRIAFPLPLYLGAWLIGALPPFLADRLLAWSPVKSES